MEVHHPVFYVSLRHMQNSMRSSVTLKLKLTLTLTDTGGAVLTLMLGTDRVSPVELRLNLDKKGVKLENSSFEAECLPYQHIKSPQESALGKKVTGENSRWPPDTLKKQ